MNVPTLCLCLCLLAGSVYGDGPVASICRSNERLLMCGGCQKTCLMPVPTCAAVCRVGCYCADDEVRNSTGHCVKLSECPPLPPFYKQDTTEPRPSSDCPEHEEYRFCEPCNRTCDNPNPICPAQCSRGCFCKQGLVRDRDGRCVRLEKCSNRSSNEIPHPPRPTKPVPHDICGPNQEFKHCSNCEKTCHTPNPPCPAQCTRGCFCKDHLYKAPNGDCVEFDKCPKVNHTKAPIAYQLTCGANQVYKHCENCEKTCSNPNPQCPAQCQRGCFCKDGLYKAPNGECVSKEKCPKAEVSMGYEDSPSIEDCAANEVYVTCGWCEGSCSQPTPACAGACSRGCLCRPPLLRHRSGRCVEPHRCLPQRCPTPNEEYVCLYGCEARCDGRTCVARPRRCTLGCRCRRGLLRDGNGKCVLRENCVASAKDKKLTDFRIEKVVWG